MLDSDLAAIYGVSTKRLNEQVKRNVERFPGDFMFHLTAKEAAASRSQIATSSGLNQSQIATGAKSRSILKSQNATSSSHGGRRSRPYAFTEYGALMAANVLNSERAVQMSVFVIRAFVKMRETLLGTRELAKKLALLEKNLTGARESSYEPDLGQARKADRNNCLQYREVHRRIAGLIWPVSTGITSIPAADRRRTHV
jgi:phage regulator Rha-like protein